MSEYIKRLKLCIKWFQELEESYLIEREKLENDVEVSERQRDEMGMNNIFCVFEFPMKLFTRVIIFVLL